MKMQLVDSKMVCCNVFQTGSSIKTMMVFVAISFLWFCPAKAQQAGKVEVEFVGDLIETDHGVGGKVYILDQDTIVIDQFSFDNDGFGVYINVATRGRNKKSWTRWRIDVPYPSGTEGEPIEKLYKGDGQIILDLKQVGVKARNVKWLSFYCTVFEQSFGHVVF